MIDELNFPKIKYQCICSDCKHTFISEETPFPRKNVFSRLFSRKGAQTDVSESSGHCAPAFSAESLKEEKNPVRCPKCGSQKIILGAITD